MLDVLIYLTLTTVCLTEEGTKVWSGQLAQMKFQEGLTINDTISLLACHSALGRTTSFINIFISQLLFFKEGNKGLKNLPKLVCRQAVVRAEVSAHYHIWLSQQPWWNS